MRTASLVLAVLAGACGPAAPVVATPVAAPVETSVAAPVTDTSAVVVGDLEEVATRLGRAMIAGDRAAALALTMPYAEVRSLVARPFEEVRWDGEVTAFFNQIDHEVASARHAGTEIRLVGVNTRKTQRLAPATDRKVTREIDVAIVELQLIGRDRAARPLAMVFMRSAAGWRFSPVK